MLYEPLPGSAAVILVQLGIIEQGQIEALGQRTYDAESGRLSLALDDGRTVELERAMHLQSEDGYAVRIRSRAGQTISRSFIHIDRNLAVRNLHNDRMVYIDDIDEPDDATPPDFSPLETAAHAPAEQQPAEEFPTAPSIDPAADEGTPAEELHASPAEHKAPHAESLHAEPELHAFQAEAVEFAESHSKEEPESEALHVEAGEFEEMPPEAAHIGSETLHAEPGIEPEQAEGTPLQAEAATEPEALPSRPESDPEAVAVHEASGAAAETYEPELHAVLEPIVKSEPDLHIEAILAAEETIEPAFEPAVEPEIHGEALPVSQAATEPFSEPEAVLSEEATPSGEDVEAPEVSLAPELKTTKMAQAEAGPEKPIATAEAVAPLAAAESSVEALESQDIHELIAAEPEASIVEAPEPETPEPTEAVSAAVVAEEPSFDRLAEPEEPQTTETLEATPEPEPVDPRYLPLHESLAPEDAAFFDFIAQTGTVHTYEHRETFRYIHIDAPSGLFYDQTRTPISRSAALKHALTPRVLVAPTPEPEPDPTPATQAAASELAPPPSPPAVTEPELRTRSHSLANGHARAAVKLDPDPATPPTDTGLSLDAFTRKRAQLERDSWRARLSEISRALRGNRTPTDDN